MEVLKLLLIESKEYLDQIQKYQHMIADNKIKAIQKLDVEYYDLSNDLKKEISILKNHLDLKTETIK